MNCNEFNDSVQMNYFKQMKGDYLYESYTHSIEVKKEDKIYNKKQKHN